MTTERRNSDASVAIVTGGSRGIGRAIVEGLARAGVEVRFSYLSNERAAAEIVEQLSAEGCTVRAVCVDARDIVASTALVEQTITERQRLDILVNNAAIIADNLLAVMTEDEWSSVLQTTLNGLFGATKPASKQMMRQRSGRIINLASVSGVVGVVGQANYCAAKSAVIGFTRSVAKELARWGVSVNAVAPGYVDTDMLSALSAERRAAAIASVPMRRFATVAEIAALVNYLAMSCPSYLTGQTLVIDGGLTA
jgi:3-oxoacyl-[acyl-carrier protein] reductase